MTDKKLSDLIESQVPFFVRNDHPKFMAFMEAYYEYLEQEGKTVDRATHLLEYRDVDETVTEFSERLYQTFLEALPKNITADRDLIIKHVKDFYRARGTEKSLRFLMRIISGEESEFYYPKTDILRASDGKWYIQQSLRVLSTTINGVANTDLSGIELLVNRRVEGEVSGATATIERIDRFYEQGVLVDELVLSSIDGDFSSGEVVMASFPINGVTYNVATTIISGAVQRLNIINPGSQYAAGQQLVFESETGSGAAGIISRVSTGNVSNISITYSGAGFLANDQILVTGGGGTGANARVASVNATGYFHPANYTLYTTLVQDMNLEQVMGTEPYGNLSTAIVASPNANSRMDQTLRSTTYGPCGPVDVITIIAAGDNYTSNPTIGVVANTRIREIGILGRMDIVNPGTNYTAGDKIEFTNVPGGYGTGARGNISVVNGTGSIVRVDFLTVPGFYPGGVGYSQDHLPTATITTSTGSGGSIRVTSVLGDGEILTSNTGTVGQILEVLLQTGGVGYQTAPYVNLQSTGSGTANIQAVIVAGVYNYPGRYLNDDGHLSSTNYLQDRDYYQLYSYVVKVKDSLANYKNALLSLTHPSGTALFSEYVTGTNLLDMNINITSNVSVNIS